MYFTQQLFLFGFSRGAYTARMTAHFIVRSHSPFNPFNLIHLAQGEMGVLDKHDMEYFPKIFMAYQTKNKPKHRTGLNDYHHYLDFLITSC